VAENVGMELRSDEPIPDSPARSGLPVRARTAWERLQRTWAFRTWKDLQDLGFVRSSLEFAGLFLLSFVPFLLLVSSALGSNLPRAFATRAGFSPGAAHDVTSLFTRSGNGSTPLSIVSIVLIVISADAIATRLQTWCGAVYDVTPDPLRAWGRRALWLCGVLGFLAAQIAIGRHAGHLTIASTTLEFVALVLFWWWSLHCLLDRVGWRRLLPGGVIIAVLSSLVGVGISLLGPSSITSSAQTYGPIGTVMTLMEALVALGLAIHLGAYIGARWFPYPGTTRAGDLEPVF
jgi:membrane protein